MAKPITCKEAWQVLTAGRCQIVDVREPGEFAREHPKGAINVVFSRKGLADRMETVLAAESAVILLAAEDEMEDATAQVEASRFRLIGVIEGGMAAWAAAGLPVGSVREVGIDELPPVGGPGLLLDVREPFEWENGYVPGARLIALGDLRGRLGDLPRTEPIVIICEAGIRSCTAASMLLAAGFEDVAHVPAGTRRYREARLPLEFVEHAPAERR